MLNTPIGIRGLAACCLLLLGGIGATPVSAATLDAPFALLQAVLKINPSVIVVEGCSEHAADTEHELDIIDVGTGQVIGTVLLGDPPLIAGTQDFEATISVMPFRHGDYRFAVRAVVGTFKSPSLVDDEVWARRPAAPGGFRIIR